MLKHNLDIALQKLPDYKGVVYRSLLCEEMEDPEAFLNLHTEDSIVLYKAYTSASTEGYDEFKLVIRSKTGRDMRSYNSPEQEVFFERETYFIITRKKGKKIWMKEL